MLRSGQALHSPRSCWEPEVLIAVIEPIPGAGAVWHCTSA